MTGSERTFDSIPLIDISQLIVRGPEGAAATVAEIRRAASEVGFFYVCGHGCPPILLDRLVAQAKHFFALPVERKMEIYIGNSPNHRGYVPPGEEVFAGGTPDSKEAFDLALDLSSDDPDARRNPHMLGPNQWPDLPGFAVDAMAYYQAVFNIGKHLLQGFAAALGKPGDFFDRFVTKPPSQLRMIHYPFTPAQTDEAGIGSHTDYECFTLLAGTAPGLEVLNGAGQWIDAPPRPGAFIVNIGDLLDYWSGGLYVATSHRVRKVSEERYSFPFFFCVDYDTPIVPVGSRAGEASPLIAGNHLYAQTIQTFRYLQQRLARGEARMPDDALSLSSFGREARQRDKAGEPAA
jgi:isopenicillin N synthase-like dioxygenase